MLPVNLLRIVLSVTFVLGLAATAAGGLTLLASRRSQPAITPVDEPSDESD